MTWVMSRTGIPGTVCGSFPRMTKAASVTKCIGMKYSLFGDSFCRLSRAFEVSREEIKAKHSKLLPKYLKAVMKYCVLLSQHLSSGKEKHHPLVHILIQLAGSK